MSGIVLSAVSHGYSGADVLTNVSVVTRPGEVLALVGPSGCGKTTLAHVAAGTLRPRKGRVHRNYRRHGMIFQQPRLLPWADARDNIGFVLEMDGLARAEARARAEVVAATVALEPADLEKFPDALSGGMRARVAIARALAVEPDFLICDEPFAALDAALRRRMQDLVIAATLERGFGGLIITHDLFEAARLSHRILVMDRRGRGVRGQVAPPGALGARSDAEVFGFVQHSLNEDPLFSELHEVDERALPAGGTCDLLGPKRCC